jgi:hypothetical protein
MAASEPLLGALQAYVEAAVAHAIDPDRPEPVGEARALSAALDAHVARCVAETLVKMREAARL